jgi:hypothetical protein
VSLVNAPERLVALPKDEKPAGSATEEVIVVEGILHAPRSDGSSRWREPHGATRGVMSPPGSAEPGPGLMSIPSRPSRGLIEPDPNTPPFEWSRDGIAFLWLTALMLALVLEIGLVARGATRGVGETMNAAVGGPAEP